MADVGSEIKKTNEELRRKRRLAKVFASEYRRYKRQKPELAPAYRLLCSLEKRHIKNLKKYLQKLESLKKRLVELQP